MSVIGVMSISVSRDSDASDMGDKGPMPNLLWSPGESAPGAVFDRLSGRGRCSSDAFLSKGFGKLVFFSGGKTSNLYDGDAVGDVLLLRRRGTGGISRS